MAITIIKKPEGIYPAYNDSFVVFSSDLANNNKAEITAYPSEIFERTFIIYPDADGNYYFNLKEIAKVRLNQSGFIDSNYFINQYSKNIEGLYITQQIDIEVFNDSTSETKTEYYDFSKSVKQIGETIFENEFQLLSYSKDGINYNLTYFEGFPFHIDILKVSGTNDIIVKNLNTENEKNFGTPTEEGSFRINIDKGSGDNWTFDNVLPLIEGLNRLEVYEGSNFKANLLLYKIKKCSGVYLKWFNQNGGYSHYLFDEYYVNKDTSKDLGSILKSDFSNVNEITGIVDSIGKETSGTKTIKTRYNQEEYNILKEIFESPSVQMFNSFEANSEGKFIDVKVEGSISHSNKKALNELKLTIDLPEVITAKY